MRAKWDGIAVQMAAADGDGQINNENSGNWFDLMM